MNDVMFDLETLGTRPTSQIIQIGACYFDRETGKIGKTFSVNTIHPFWDWRFTRDGETVVWWKNQSEDARKAVFSDGVFIDDALIHFAEFLKKGKYLWSHATFDVPVITNAFYECRVKNPIHFRNMRDIRTLMDLADHYSRKERKGIHHNALDDCRYQVEYVVEALNKLKACRYEENESTIAHK